MKSELFEQIKKLNPGRNLELRETISCRMGRQLVPLYQIYDVDAERFVAAFVESVEVAEISFFELDGVVRASEGKPGLLECSTFYAFNHLKEGLIEVPDEFEPERYQ